MLEENNWIEFVHINPNELDIEWVGQPKKYMVIAEKTVDARAETDALKLRLEELQSKIDSAIRANPAKYGLDKITEGGVLSAIKRHPKFLAVSKELLVAKKKLGLCEQVLSALDHRKKALENLVYLHGQSYFSKPRESEEFESWAKQKARKTTRKANTNA